MSDEMREKVALSDSLRRGLEAMACYGSAPMDLWDRFSNDVLKAADEITALLDELERVERERDEAIKLMSQYATEAGFAKGKLEMSEAAGVVDMWREHAQAAEARATAAEARLAEAVEVMSEELKPCPFCGGDELGLVCDPSEGLDNSGPSRAVQCYRCHVEAPFYGTEAAAIAAWNTRAAAPEMAEALEELLGVAELYVPVPLDAPGFKRARAALAKARGDQ